MSNDGQAAAPILTPTAAQAAISTTTPIPAVGATSYAQSMPLPEPEITLDQFGIELSHRDKRVELLNAFVFAERQAKHFKDTRKHYLARFDAFADQPA